MLATSLPFYDPSDDNGIVVAIRERIIADISDIGFEDTDRHLLQHTGVRFPEAHRFRRYDLINVFTGRKVGCAVSSKATFTDVFAGYCCAIVGLSVIEVRLRGRGEDRAEYFADGTLMGTATRLSQVRSEGSSHLWELRCMDSEFGVLQVPATNPVAATVVTATGEERHVALQMNRTLIDFGKVIANLLSFAWIAKRQLFRVSPSPIIGPEGVSSIVVYERGS